MDDWGRGKCTLTFDPPLAASTRGWVRVTVDGTMLASWSAQEMSGAWHMLGPATAWTTLPESDRVNATTPTLMWEVSPDGEHWLPAGTSGPHTMYWTEAAPIVLPFEDRTGRTWGEVYDLAVGLACSTEERFAAQPAILALPLRKRIARLVSEDVTYNGFYSFVLTGEHPLGAIAFQLGAQCEDHANPLKGSLRRSSMCGTSRAVSAGTTPVVERSVEHSRGRFPLSTVPQPTRILRSMPS